jgi:ubiquinol-cytochrome c reductase iron-sulfur subunit
LRFLIAIWVAIKTVAKLPRARRRRRERIVPAGPADAGGELIVVGFLLAAAAFAIAFVVFYVVGGIGSQTQLLGIALGGALLCFAGAFIVAAERLVVTEEIEEPYPEPHPREQETVTQIVEESGSRLTRKKLLGGAAAVAGGAMGAALIAPVASFGPALDSHLLLETPWRRGRRLVREDNVPVKASDIEGGSFYTAFAEGASHDLIGAPLVVVRLPPQQLKLPRGRRGWAPQGIVAYSKICTHAGCAIALYRKPTYQPTSQPPALACPCHYSVFATRRGGVVESGPAGRPLPQLPLQIGPDGELQAAGPLSGSAGPGWWSTRR